MQTHGSFRLQFQLAHGNGNPTLLNRLNWWINSHVHFSVFICDFFFLRNHILKVVCHEFFAVVIYSSKNINEVARKLFASVPLFHLQCYSTGFFHLLLIVFGWISIALHGKWTLLYAYFSLFSLHLLYDVDNNASFFLLLSLLYTCILSSRVSFYIMRFSIENTYSHCRNLTIVIVATGTSLWCSCLCSPYLNGLCLSIVWMNRSCVYTFFWSISVF